MNMILPLEYWGDELRAHWPELDNIIEKRRVTHNAQLVVWEARSRSPKPRRRAEVDEIAIAVTPIAARAFARLVRESGAKGRAYAAVGFHTRGPNAGNMYVNVANGYDAEVECCYESNGVRVVIPIDQAHRFRRAILDYSEIFGWFSAKNLDADDGPDESYHAE
jgi:hypothetical protein